MNRHVEEIVAISHPVQHTPRARQCIVLAVECADELGDTEFDSCHLLAGLLREGQGVAAHALKNFGVTTEQIDDALRARERILTTNFQIGVDIKSVFDNAFATACEMSHNYIGTEHLLIGTTADTTRSAQILTGLGLSREDIEKAVFRLLGHRLP